MRGGDFTDRRTNPSTEQHLAVFADYIGRGTRLINFIEDRLKEKKQRLLIVETSELPEFEPTRRFYKNYGFSKEAIIKDFYQAGEDKVIFTKAINR